MANDEIINQLLHKLYYDVESSAAYSGLSQLMHALKNNGLKVSRDYVKKWLEGQQIYTMYKPHLNKKMKSRQIVVNSINDMWDIDLADLSTYSASNDDIKYLMVAIDILSRKIHVYPLKNKQASTIINALQILFNKFGTPRKLRSDRGTEFTANAVQSYLRPILKQYFATGPQKAAYAESAVKTVKNRIIKSINATENENYIHHLDKIVKGINDSYHSALNTTPNSVTKDNELKIWAHLYIKPKSIRNKYLKKPFSYKVGQIVKTPIKKGKLHREYWINWSEEPKQIINKFRSFGINLYKLKDYSGKKIPGTFQEAQLQPINYDIKNNNTLLKIKILKHIKNKRLGDKYKIHFENWPDKYNKWVSAKELFSEGNFQQRMLPNK